MITETDTGYSSCGGHIKYTEIPLVPNHKWRGLYDRYLRYIINDEHHDFNCVVEYANLGARDESWLIDTCVSIFGEDSVKD